LEKFLLHLILINHLGTTTKSIALFLKNNKHTLLGKETHKRTGSLLFSSSNLYKKYKYPQFQESHSMANQQLAICHSTAEFIPPQAQRNRNISSIMVP